jgi:hypothetical protein
MPNELGWKIKEWCQRWGISTGTFYNMKTKKRAPKVTDTGVWGPRITPTAERQWLKERKAWAKSDEAKKAAERRSAVGVMAGELAAKSAKHISNRKKQTPPPQAAE